MKRYDQISSLIWFLLAVYICVESIQLPLGSWRDPGPGFLPLLVGLILAGLSIICFIQAWMAESTDQKAAWYSRERWKKLIGVLLALSAYALVLDHLGFLMSTFLLLIFLFRFGMEPQRWVWAIGGVGSPPYPATLFLSYGCGPSFPKGFWDF